ncbi:undecaprenyl pyrophosphate synthase [Bacteroidales bacterium]|nr:undecaprenyl pyrophosphate synthase [Bacteroidales bacterium]
MSMSLKEKIDLSKLPSHIAIIMDGNGRWAKQNGKDRFFGHQEGVVSVRKIVEAAGALGIEYLTLYTFSTENWKRPQEEVEALMDLMVMAIKQETEDLMKQGVRLLAIGDIDRLPANTKNNLTACMEQTKNNTGISLVLALSYSSRWEIVEAVKKITQQVSLGEYSAADIDEKLIDSYLTTNGIPDPDLLIRTGGECRISNFLTWQLSYSELYFTEIYWPVFREENLYQAILDYQMRERRFGKTGEQLQTEVKIESNTKK